MIPSDIREFEGRWMWTIVVTSANPTQPRAAARVQHSIRRPDPYRSAIHRKWQTSVSEIDLPAIYVVRAASHQTPLNKPHHDPAAGVREVQSVWRSNTRANSRGSTSVMVFIEDLLVRC